MYISYVLFVQHIYGVTHRRSPHTTLFSIYSNDYPSFISDDEDEDIVEEDEILNQTVVTVLRCTGQRFLHS